MDKGGTAGSTGKCRNEKKSGEIVCEREKRRLQNHYELNPTQFKPKVRHEGTEEDDKESLAKIERGGTIEFGCHGFGPFSSAPRKNNMEKKKLGTAGKR